MVTIIKQSGNPVDEGEAKAFLKVWKEVFDKLFEVEGDMAVVTEKSQAYEEELREKYKIEKNIELPQSTKEWKELLDQHSNGIMVDVHVKTGELMFIILDLGI